MSYGDRVWFCAAGERNQASSSSLDIMVASPLVHFKRSVVEAFGKFRSAAGCEGETLPELGLL
jgi:hypothetical protein